MRHHELTVTDKNIAGTWVQPDGTGPFPTVVMLSAGKIDRDGNLGKAKINYGPPFAAALAERGIASFRYDRRGVGKTPGKWSDGGVYGHRDDAAEVVRAISARKDVGALGLIGLSEGAAVHASWLASRTDAQAVVLLGCPTTVGPASMIAWAESLRKDEMPAFRWICRLFGRTPGEQTRVLCERIVAGDRRIYGFKVPAWMRDFLTHDPAPDLARIHIPTLAITGDKDRQVNPDDLEVIRRIVPGPVDVHRFPDLTHMLRRDPGPASLNAYKEQYTRPVEPELVAEVADWLADKLDRCRATP